MNFMCESAEFNGPVCTIQCARCRGRPIPFDPPKPAQHITRPRSSTDDVSLCHWRGLPPLRITVREAMALPEYSASYPTGVTIGKRWRRHNGAHDPLFRERGGVPRWVICVYEPDQHDEVHAIVCSYRPVVRVPMGRRVERDIFTEFDHDCIPGN